MEEKGFENINVIPLVDIMLVLLAIVLTTSTFISTGAIPIELPKASSSHAAAALQVVEIDRAGRLFFNSRPSDMASFTASIEALGRSTPILIRADRNTILQVFVDVLDAVRSRGFRNISLQTQQG